MCVTESFYSYIYTATKLLFITLVHYYVFIIEWLFPSLTSSDYCLVALFLLFLYYSLYLLAVFLPVVLASQILSFPCSSPKERRGNRVAVLASQIQRREGKHRRSLTGGKALPCFFPKESAPVFF
jgi:hypothetical protein